MCAYERRLANPEKRKAARKAWKVKNKESVRSSEKRRRARVRREMSGA